MTSFSTFMPFQFNIAIQDHPDVTVETKKALHGSQSDSISSRLPLCVEISLQTVDGDKMLLEVWSLNINPDLNDPQTRASYTVYNRMSILLKSLISITRVTPAYKLSRRQSLDSYSIYYRIYSGEPQHNLGECRLCNLFQPFRATTASASSKETENRSEAIAKLAPSTVYIVCFVLLNHAVHALDALALTVF